MGGTLSVLPPEMRKLESSMKTINKMAPGESKAKFDELVAPQLPISFIDVRGYSMSIMPVRGAVRCLVVEDAVSTTQHGIRRITACNVSDITSGHLILTRDTVKYKKLEVIMIECNLLNDKCKSIYGKEDPTHVQDFDHFLDEVVKSPHLSGIGNLQLSLPPSHPWKRLFGQLSDHLPALVEWGMKKLALQGGSCSLQAIHILLTQMKTKGWSVTSGYHGVKLKKESMMVELLLDQIKVNGQDESLIKEVVATGIIGAPWNCIDCPTNQLNATSTAVERVKHILLWEPDYPDKPALLNECFKGIREARDVEVRAEVIQQMVTSTANSTTMVVTSTRRAGNSFIITAEHKASAYDYLTNRDSDPVANRDIFTPSWKELVERKALHRAWEPARFGDLESLAITTHQAEYLGGGQPADRDIYENVIRELLTSPPLTALGVLQMQQIESESWDPLFKILPRYLDALEAWGVKRAEFLGGTSQLHHYTDMIDQVRAEGWKITKEDNEDNKCALLTKDSHKIRMTLIRCTLLRPKGQDMELVKLMINATGLIQQPKWI